MEGNEGFCVLPRMFAGRSLTVLYRVLLCIFLTWEKKIDV